MIIDYKQILTHKFLFQGRNNQQEQSIRKSI